MEDGTREIQLSVPNLGPKEKKALNEVIDSGWLTMGARVADFESAFAELHGINSAVAVNSCTAALHIILKALDIGPGDEVLVPSLTFVATVNAVLYVGATPVFLDIDRFDIPHVSIKEAEHKITSRTKAVIIMHYGGYLLNLPEWRSFCDNKGIKLIEDAAHAPGIGKVGRLSDAAGFSFFSNKNMTTAEGGMITARDDSIIKNMRHQRGHGMTSDTLNRHRGHAYSYDVTMLGFNYRLDELRAALGLVQLKLLPEWINKRISLSLTYREYLFDQLKEVVIPFKPDHETAAHLMPIILPPGTERKKVMQKLRDEGIQSSIHYPPVHLFSF